MELGGMNRYRRWFEYENDAHAKVVASLESVPTDHRVGKDYLRAVSLLAHIVAARRLWLSRLGIAGVAAGPLFPADLDINQVIADWQCVSALWSEYLARVDDTELSRVFEYESTDGSRFRNQVDDIFAHLFGHSSYHRGQIAQLVRAAGGTPAETDLVFWCRELIPNNPGT